MTNLLPRFFVERPLLGTWLIHLLYGLYRQYRAGDARTKEDLIAKLPAELRLMIFEDLLIAEKTVYRGAADFGNLHADEYHAADNPEAKLYWKVLLTSCNYYNEAVAMLYGKNRIVLCTGLDGSPGMFDPSPMAVRDMPLLKHLSIYYQAGNSKSEAAIKVASFLDSVRQHATNLEHLTIMISSDRHTGGTGHFDILYPFHPVAEELLKIVTAKPAKHLKIRLHNDAALYPNFGVLLRDTFEQGLVAGQHTLTFTMSCTCPQAMPVLANGQCSVCLWPRGVTEDKSIEIPQENAWNVEADVTRLMDMESDLYHAGINTSGDLLEDPEDFQRTHEALLGW